MKTEAGICTMTEACLQADDLNWLLHRSAQRLGAALDAEAQRHGIGVRGHVVLTSVLQEPGRTQLALGAALGIDKTTLTALLDRLEQDKLVVRTASPHDRRKRIPEVTEAGAALQARVAAALRQVEKALLAEFTSAEQNTLRELLHRFAVADDGGRPAAGSCL